MTGGVNYLEKSRLGQYEFGLSKGNRETDFLQVFSGGVVEEA